ncbi:hypothetical protein PsorP6_001652 [Peronosclerospora sorghi]|uniref:Uncharacterized protein n=1 Tax=Peronosclerospora sorghi TaxID=230839 RepID=A0ACC0WWI0_9STRA|nr:hypothetical protein PsorP6_001652 [Peronosclerospora sorghi]
MASAPDYCGWGAKEGRKVRTWKQRYFVLSGRELIYYSGAKRNGRGAGVGEKGRLNVVNVADLPDRTNGLVIYGEKKTLKMTTASAHERRLLFRKLKHVIGEHEPSFHGAKGREDGAMARAVEASSCVPETVERHDMDAITDTELIAQKYITQDALSPSTTRSYPTTRGPPFPSNGPLDEPSDVSKDPVTPLKPLVRADSHGGANSPVAEASDCIKSGWLYQQEHERSSWILRYFVLRGKHTLECYPSGNERAALRGNVLNVRYEQEASRRYVSVALHDGNAVHVYGETKADTEAWYAAFCKASWTTVDTSGEKEDARGRRTHDEAAQGTGCRGWLLKKGQHFKTWKRRYFVLERSRLAYRAAPTSDVLGTGVVLDVEVGTLRPFCLTIRFQHGRVLHVVAPTPAAFSKWLAGLEQASKWTRSLLAPSTEKQALADEFDHDGGDEPAKDADVEFTDQDMAEDDQSLREEGGGASLWLAAMANEPEDETLSSSSSHADDDVVGTAPASSPPRPSASAGCTGWLTKQGRTVKSWKRRFWTLHGTTLSYYKSERGALVRTVDVVNVQTHVSIPHGLLVSTRSGRDLVLQADSTHERARWVQALRDAVASTTTKVVATTQWTHESVRYSGWLEKEGQRFKTWKRRYFIVHTDGTLLYYREKSGAGGARGHGRVHRADVDASKPRTLVLTFQGGKRMRVTAATRAQMDAWLDALSCDRLSTRTTDVSDGSSDDKDVACRRYDSSEYLNDPVSHDTFMRLYDDVNGQATVLDACHGAPRSFKGELTFGEEEESKDEEGVSSTTGAEYYRHLVAEAERMEHERAAEKKDVPPWTGCAPCCIVM